MKFWGIFRFEFKYQLRKVSTWIYLGILFLLPLCVANIGKPTDDTTYHNAPSSLILLTVFGNVIWLLMAGAIAGDAGARDVQTRIFSLMYVTPISKAEYLGGRFLASFSLNALIQLAIPVSFLLAFHGLVLNPGLIGPFRPEVYLTTYIYMALPLAFVATACQFTFATLERSAIVAYVASILLFPVISQFVGTSIAHFAGNWEISKLIDLVGLNILADMETWTPVENNTRMVRLEGMFLWNRLMWLGIAVGALAYTYFRFQLVYPVSATWWSKLKRKRKAVAATTAVTKHSERAHISIPEVTRKFGFATQIEQARAIAWSSFGMIVRSKAGLSVMLLFVLQLVVFAPEYMSSRGVPQYPTTMNVLSMLSAPLRDLKTPLILIPILIIFYAGELIWREREAGLSKISDTVPVNEWVLFLGKFFGLSLMILVWLSLLTAGGILMQVTQGFTKFEIDVYLKVLFGIQLTNYLLFALLALAVHVLVNQKYLGLLVLLMIYLYIGFASKLGIEHNLLIFGSDPGITYTDMRGFEPYLGSWMWFKVYWASWILLLVVAASLLWNRSVSQGIRERINLMRHRFTHKTASIAGLAVVMIILSGGYIFYNTNILNKYTSASDANEQLAGYELRYSKYRDAKQPILTDAKLHVELYPDQRKAELQGIYTLVNKSGEPIDTIHLATAWGVATENISFNRPFNKVLDDEVYGHQMYTLQKPMLPGEILQLNFKVYFASEGFTNKEIDPSVISNGSYFVSYNWLPAIGYMPYRELRNANERKKYGLAKQTLPAPNIVDTYKRLPGQELIDFEAVVGTQKGQLAVAPGELKRQWTENGRSYFQYATSAPIRNTYSFFSAKYASRQTKWKNVDIRLYFHPEHTENIDRIIQSIKSSLSFYTSKFGPYPYSHLTIIERSGYAGELNAEPTTIDYGESFTLSNLKDNQRVLDIVYFALAHEVSHQWWGAAQLIPARAEGTLLLSEALANYSGLSVMDDTFSNEQVQQLLAMWRDSYEVPRSRATTPLLQATDPFLGYRKGPLAMYALTQYIGKEKVDTALRQLMHKHGSGKSPLATSLDLYTELKAVTPDSLHYFLRDYFEENIYWQLKTEQADAKQINDDTWQVTLQVEAKKVRVDSDGAEKELPMNDWIEIGIYDQEEGREKSDGNLYLQKHKIRSGQQKIVVLVKGKPTRAGIDPNHLLIDLELENNIKAVKRAGEAAEPPSLI